MAWRFDGRDWRVCSCRRAGVIGLATLPWVGWSQDPTAPPGTRAAALVAGVLPWLSVGAVLLATWWAERGSSGTCDMPTANWVTDQFYGGRAAMITTGPWNFVNARSKVKDVWDVAMLPRGKAGSISWIAGSGFGISSSTKYKNEAWQVLKYITSTEGLSQVAKAGRGYPGRASATQAFYRTDVPPEHQQIIAKQAETGKAYRTNSTWQEILDQLKRDLVDPIAVLGNPVTDAVKSAEPAYQALLDKGAA